MAYLGSGKSTLAQKFKNIDTELLEADQYFMTPEGKYKYDQSKIGAAHTWCQDCTEAVLKSGESCIVSNTFTTIRELRPYFDIALKYGILPTVILCQNQYQNVHAVPQEVLDRMKIRFCYDISPLITEYQNKLNLLCNKMNLYMIKYPNGTTVKSATDTFAIPATDDNGAIEKSLKYGLDGIIISKQQMGSDWL